MIVEEQERVVNSRNKNIIVSASAGSGKTHTMIRRIVAMIEGGLASVDEILVLTYTNVAAEEMKAKLEARLFECSQLNQGFQNELDKLKTSDISTIHAFCQKMIKKYFYVLEGVSPNFTLCDEISSSLYKGKALKHAIDNYKKSNPDKYLFMMEKFAGKRNDKEIEQMIMKLDSFLMAKEEPEKWMSETSNRLYLIENKNSVFEAFKYFQSQFEDVEYPPIEDFENSFEDGVESLKILSEIYNIYQKQYKNIKKSKNILDFNDLEHVFLLILKQKNVCETIKKDYKYIFIDEFQDANAVQEEILSLLSNETNRFMVGDVKQSIYGFRMSKPQIFIDKTREYVDGDVSESLNLNSNFRSDKQILEFVNLVFSKLMTKDVGGMDYVNMKGEVDYQHADQKPPVELLLIPTEKKKSRIDTNKFVYSVKNHFDIIEENEEQDRFSLQSKMIAEKILELRKIPIYDENNKQFKECRFSDITILVRSRNGINKLSEKLIECGIPVFANSNSDLMDYAEIIKVVDYLSFAYCQSKDIFLAGVLMSELGANLSANDLAKIKLQNMEEKSYYECVKNYSLNNSDDISKKLLSLFSECEEFVRICEYESVFQATKWLVRKKDYHHILLASNGGLAKLARLEKLLNILEGKKSSSLCDVVKFFDNLISKLESPNLSSDDDCVNITTIHASKGLEFPIVFLFDFGSDLFAVHNKSKLSLNDEYGLALPYVNLATRTKKKSVQEYIIDSANKKEDFEEKIRLLYVAMTRAKNKLIFCGQTNLEKVEIINSTKQLLSKRNYIDMILGTLEQGVVDKLTTKTDGAYSCQNAVFSVDFMSNVNDPENKMLRTETISKPDKELTKKIVEALSYSYPYNKSVDIALKNSVSSLSFVDGEYASFNTSPKEFLRSETEPITSADKGTAYHKILEKIDFEQVGSENDVERQIADIIAFGIVDNNCVEVDSRLVFNTICKVKQIVKDSKVLKELPFVMRLKQLEVVKDGGHDEIIVQGIIDLLSVGETVIIVDYKLTKSKNQKYIKNKYQKQIDLYKLAVSKTLGTTAINAWIVPIGDLPPIQM